MENIILSMNNVNTILPIYDFSTKCEINKEKSPFFKYINIFMFINNLITS